MKIGVDGRNLLTSLSGIGRYVVEMSRHLAFNGHQLCVYLPESRRQPLPDVPGIQFHSFNFSGAARRMVWAHTALARKIIDDEIEIFWGPAHRLPIWLPKRIARVVTIHDLVWKEEAGTMRLQTWLGDRFLMRPAVARADRIVADSNATASSLALTWPAVAGKIKVIYPGLTKLNDSEDGDADIVIAGPYALFVGTLEPRKNLKRLLEAYSTLDLHLRNELLLVLAGGQGWRLNDLKDQIAMLGLQHHVRLTGYVTDSQLDKLYAGAKFVVMPSLTEGFGFPIIEANAKGVPVLTSYTASMPEVAGDAGFLVDPQSVESIAAGFRILATNQNEYEKLSRNAKANAARFDWGSSALQLQDVFVDAIGSRQSRT